MAAPRALVVFTNQHDIRWLRWLRPGFRHCFVVVRDPADEWVACDWLKGRLVFRAFGPCDPLELADRYAQRGHAVIVVDTHRRGHERAWFRLLTCVEVVKQALGWSSLLPLTPYGLFRALLATGHRQHETKE